MPLPKRTNRKERALENSPVETLARHAAYPTLVLVNKAQRILVSTEFAGITPSSVMPGVPQQYLRLILKAILILRVVQRVVQMRKWPERPVTQQHVPPDSNPHNPLVLNRVDAVIAPVRPHRASAVW